MKNGDEKEAEKLYEYLTKDIELPDFDPVQPTMMQQVKENANDLMGWIRQNSNELAQGYEFIRQIIANKGALPTMGGETPIEPLPPINE